jgi:hypothetical protein
MSDIITAKKETCQISEMQRELYLRIIEKRDPQI